MTLSAAALRRRATGACRALALAAVATIGAGGLAAVAEEGTFIHLSDIHFDPFDPVLLSKSLAASDTEAWAEKFATVTDQRLAQFGTDTNYALLVSALSAIARYGASADFALLSGDLLVHDFETRAEAALGTAPTSEATRAFAVRTTIFVADALRAAMPGKPVIVALGNNDASCGDYHIDPGGSYLAATRETVRRLVGAHLVAPDFDETYAAGGYYALRHPTAPDVVIIVLDDVLWSERYVNSCGTNEAGMAAAKGMMAWLGKRLAEARDHGGHIWLVHHIPVGIDPIATVKSNAASCPAKVVSYLKEPFASGYLKLLIDYADVIQASFTGHIHFDDYRLIGSWRRSGARRREDRSRHQSDLWPESRLPYLFIRSRNRCAARFCHLLPCQSRDCRKPGRGRLAP